MSLTFDSPGGLAVKFQSVGLEPEGLNAFRYILVRGCQGIEPVKTLLVVVEWKLSEEMAIANFAKPPIGQASRFDRLEIAVLQDLVEQLVGQC